MLKQINPLFLQSFMLWPKSSGGIFARCSSHLAELTAGESGLGEESENQKRPLLDALIDRSWEGW